MPDIDFEARRPWILAHLREMRAGGHVARAYFDGEQPVGFYTLFADTGLLEQICVNPLINGRGIGASLIADAIHQTDQRLNLVVNENNHHARAFYAKLGFAEVAIGINQTSSLPVLTLEMSA